MPPVHRPLHIHLDTTPEAHFIGDLQHHVSPGLYSAFPSGKHLEALLREAQGIVPMVIRRGHSRRYMSWLQYLAIVGRRVVETVGGMLHAMFPRRIHAVTQEGFVIKVLSFVLAHNLKLLTQEMA